MAAKSQPQEKMTTKPTNLAASFQLTNRLLSQIIPDFANNPETY
jgi:hypothetical protein